MQKRMNRRGNKPGFTLIEMMIVIIIIGIMASIAIPKYNKSVERSKASEAVMALATLAQAQERYLQKTGNYANSGLGLDVDVPANTANWAAPTINQTSVSMNRINGSVVAGCPANWMMTYTLASKIYNVTTNCDFAMP